MHWLIGILCLAQAPQGAVVIDRIAVIAGKHAIKASDVDRDVRLVEFLNNEPMNVSLDAKRKSVQRLIDQSMIRDEISTGGYSRATDSDAANMLNQIRRTRFAASDERLRQALAKYRLSEDELREELLWQLTVLRFIDERFRTGAIVTDDEAHSYYTKQDPKGTNFDARKNQIKETLQGEKVNQQFEAWLGEARKAERIEFREEDLK